MKIIFICVTSVIISISLFSQNYIPIPSDSTSEWRIWTGLNDGSCIQNREFKYFFYGDTVFNSLTYNKLYRSGFYQESALGPPPLPSCDLYYIFEDDFVGGIRNAQGKVYYYTGIQENLIYDFTVQPGDTLDTSIAGPNIIVESIDSVMIGDEYRLRFNLNNPDGFSNWIIEGLGHEKGLIEPMSLSLEFASEFYCYAENQIPIYPEDAICDLSVTVGEIPSMPLLINIYPNPSNGMITISFNSDTEMMANLKIISPLGKILVGFNWNLKQGLNEKTFDLSKISSGLFFIILDNGSSIIQKTIFLTN